MQDYDIYFDTREKFEFDDQIASRIFVLLGRSRRCDPNESRIEFSGKLGRSG